MPQNLFSPDREREFTYYDRCAIALDDVEMKAVRLRIKIAILASPLYRSQNLKYPYYKEFYGYMQTFFQNVYVDEVSINYTEMFVYDYWNEHQLLAYQVAVYLQNLKPGLELLFRIIGTPNLVLFPESAQALIAAADLVKLLDDGFITALDSGVVLSDGGTSYLNTFGSPINLLRFKFETGTVFKVTLESWSLAVTDAGTSPGNPTVEEPYDTSNPNGTTPTPSGAKDPTGLPYGAGAPNQSAIDPALDPDDFSNAPDPPLPAGQVRIQGWSWEAVPGLQSAAMAIGCPAASLGLSIPALATVQNPVSLGVRIATVDAMGNFTAAEILGFYPGFQFGNFFFAATASCGQ